MLTSTTRERHVGAEFVLEDAQRFFHPEIANLRRLRHPNLGKGHRHLLGSTLAVAKQTHDLAAIRHRLHPNLERIPAGPHGTPVCRAGSWSTAIISRFVSMAWVYVGHGGQIVACKVRGAARSAHKLKCVRYSSSLIPPFPTSSMSGSFQ